MTSKQKPDGYALQYPDGSISNEVIYRESDLDYTSNVGYEKQAMDRFLLYKFAREYGVGYSNTPLGNTGLRAIEARFKDCKMVPIKIVRLDEVEE